MTIAYTANIKGYHNVDYGRAFVMLQSASVPADITGTSFKMTITDASGAIVKELAVGTGITITDGPTGAWRIDLTEIEMTALGVGKFSHEMIWTQGTFSQVLWRGKMTILQGLGTP